MKNSIILLFVLIFSTSFAQARLKGGSIAGDNAPGATCPIGGINSSSGTLNLTANCKITGDVTLSGTAALLVSGAVLTISGNLTLIDQAKMTVSNGGLTFPQSDYNQFVITLNKSAHFSFINSQFITNGTGSSNFSMNINAYGNSSVDFTNSNLSTGGTGSWLLGAFHEHSTLNVSGSTDLPTEIYPSDASQISVTSNSDLAGVWLEFKAGSSGTINVPQMDSFGRYNFDFGGSPGFEYTVHWANSKGRLGLNSHPNSTMIVNGGGASSTTDIALVFGYYVENNTTNVSINGLSVGNDKTLQFTDQGRNLSLNHVNLNPFSWQVYVDQSNGFPVTITNSLINPRSADRNVENSPRKSQEQLSRVDLRSSFYTPIG